MHFALGQYPCDGNFTKHSHFLAITFVNINWDHPISFWGFIWGIHSVFVSFLWIAYSFWAFIVILHTQKEGYYVALEKSSTCVYITSQLAELQIKWNSRRRNSDCCVRFLVSSSSKKSWHIAYYSAAHDEESFLHFHIYIGVYVIEHTYTRLPNFYY